MYVPFFLSCLCYDGDAVAVLDSQQAESEGEKKEAKVLRSERKKKRSI